MSFINYKKENFEIGNLVKIWPEFLIKNSGKNFVGLIVKIKSLESIREIHDTNKDLGPWKSLKWVLEENQIQRISEYYALVLFNKHLEVFSLDALTKIEKN